MTVPAEVVVADPDLVVSLRNPFVDPATVAAIHDQVISLSEQGGDPDDSAMLTDLVRSKAPLLSDLSVQAVVTAVTDRLRGLGPLEPVLGDPAITEVMINGPGRVWVERLGRVAPTDVTVDRAMIELIIERIISPLGLRADRASPMVDARLPDGSRVNAVVPPLAVDGPYLTIRRFAQDLFPLADYGTPFQAAVLAWAVQARLNIVVSGGTGAGKTSLLNALANEIGRSERVVTIEDAAELRLPGAHVVRLEARPANAEGAGGVDTRTLVRNALRMRPDRIIVGEVRGAEALDMVQAMNTGHEGSLSTCHANSADDALRRLETMVLMNDVDLPLEAIRDHLLSAIDMIVQIGRGPDGGRAIESISEVVDMRLVPIASPGGPTLGPRSSTSPAFEWSVLP